MKGSVAGVVLALATVLAGCLGGSSEGEPLTRGDVAEPATRAELAWASLENATIRPGVTIHTEKRDCASNFVFARPDNRSLFLGTTAHCVRDLPIGSLAQLGERDGNLGMLVYSSWDTMDEIREQDPAAHEYNDFAVFYIDSSVRDQVNPTLLHYGGPTGLADFTKVDLAQRVRSYAPGPLSNLTPKASEHDGLVTGRVGDWAFLVHNGNPVTPGTMGGGVMLEDGRALGVVVNLAVVPSPGANGVARLDALLAYAEAHARLPLVVATADLLPGGLVAEVPADLPLLFK